MANKHSAKGKQSSSKPRQGERGVVLAVKVHIDVKFTGLVKQKHEGIERDSLFNLLLGDSSSLSAELIAQPDVQCLTISQGRKDTVTFVYRGGRPTAFWDSKSRTHADLAQIEPPNNNIYPSANLKIIWGKENSGVVAEITSNDPTLGPVRHELHFNQSKELLPFSEAVFTVLFCGPQYHLTSGLPYQELIRKGFLTSLRTYLGDSKEPFSEAIIEPLGIEEVAPAEFEAPSGYKSLKKLLKSPKQREPVIIPDDQAKETQAASVRFALNRKIGHSTYALEINEQVTPDCLGTTRLGSMAATLHQDFFDNTSNAVNTVAPLLGRTTIASGSWSVPWLSSLDTIRQTSPRAPGSGIYYLLRDPRRLSTSPGGPSGGKGLLDLIAFQNLTQPDDDGLTRTQREARAGTLATTLARWGTAQGLTPQLTPLVWGAIESTLINTNGDLNQLSKDDQRIVVDAYETAELGVFTIGGLPETMGPFPFGSVTIGPIVIGDPRRPIIIGPVITPDLMAVSITGISGIVDFSGLGGGPLLTTARIGNGGNVVLGFALPTINLSATISRNLTLWGHLGVVGISAAIIGLGALISGPMFAFTWPVFSSVGLSVGALFEFVTNNVTSVTADATGVTITLDVQYGFDAASGRVEPHVTVVSSTGLATITTSWQTPNIVGNLFDSMVTGLGNQFNIWLPLLANLLARRVQDMLRDQGLHLPVAGRQTSLRGVAGSASSIVDSLLQLSVELVPEENTQPFTTQVIPQDGIERQLVAAHLEMRQDLNPQPVPAAPGPGAALTIATYAGLGISQNALNYYICHQWIQGRFNIEITSPSVINAIFSAVPPTLFQQKPDRIHVWPATQPRVETTPAEMVSGGRALLVFFDDVRACFSIPNGHGTDNHEGFSGHWELCFNVKAPGTIQLSWPWVFNVRVETASSTVLPSDERSWEWIDPSIPDAMGKVLPSDLEKVVYLLAQPLLLPLTAAAILPPNNPANWSRPLPATQELVFPSLQGGLIGEQRLYLELMERRKALYILPALDSILLQLIDGSGAPKVNQILQDLKLGFPGTFVSLSVMDRDQGIWLRDTVLPAIKIPAGP
ncbi:MAG: hypothetical protein A2Y88_10280 [Chloroflexi bacterium RBG_13_48_10]|nr:MAG: hypothetical protein A2Y88_10280 [Chloroflexi bacterium RBG_13_48_10]